jgi:hypothetical protein
MSPGTVAARFPGAPLVGDRGGIRQLSLDTLLGGMEPSSAELVRAAMGWLVPEGVLFMSFVRWSCRSSSGISFR